MKFCADLLEEKGVALVPGLAFGTEGYIRFSFATDLESIQEGIRRIKDFTEKRSTAVHDAPRLGKTFNKIDHRCLGEALEKMSVDQ